MRAAEFREVILRAGLQAPDHIEAGKLYRIPGDGKGPRNAAGWCKLFADSRGGVFGDWSTGLFETWRAARDKPLTPAERQAFTKQCAEAKAERERTRQAEQQTAADQAAIQYGAAGAPHQTHAYLIRKGITAPPSVRQSGGLLLIPMRDATKGKLRGLQSITPDGSKRFTAGMGITGCSFAFEGMKDGPIAICEGFATGASLHASTGWRVVCSFTANNLSSVAAIVRQQHPQARIVICADNDHGTERAGKGNAGLKAGREAAKVVRGVLVAPPAEGGSDFNDLAQTHGLDALRTALTQAAGGDA